MTYLKLKLERAKLRRFHEFSYTDCKQLQLLLLNQWLEHLGLPKERDQKGSE